nr:hypothetical protein Iba_chr12bCG22200 [Ipomoea batatas]
MRSSDNAAAEDSARRTRADARSRYSASYNEDKQPGSVIVYSLYSRFLPKSLVHSSSCKLVEWKSGNMQKCGEWSENKDGEHNAIVLCPVFMLLWISASRNVTICKSILSSQQSAFIAISVSMLFWRSASLSVTICKSILSSHVYALVEIRIPQCCNLRIDFVLTEVNI